MKTVKLLAESKKFLTHASVSLFPRLVIILEAIDGYVTDEINTLHFHLKFKAIRHWMENRSDGLTSVMVAAKKTCS